MKKFIVFRDVYHIFIPESVSLQTVSSKWFLTQIMGCGTQRGYTEYVRGSKIDVFLKPKIKFEIVVSSEDWEIKVIDAVQKAAFTGDPGDGKIFSYEIRNAVRIRTGETGYDALQSEFL